MSVFGWWAYHSLLDPGNIVATVLLYSVLGYGVRKFVWLPHIKPHLERTRELHEHFLKRECR